MVPPNDDRGYLESVEQESVELDSPLAGICLIISIKRAKEQCEKKRYFNSLQKGSISLFCVPDPMKKHPLQYAYAAESRHKPKPISIDSHFSEANLQHCVPTMQETILIKCCKILFINDYF